jgi:tetratricopeptide (TPR) repeat protein
VGSGAAERDPVGHVELLVNLLLADPLDAKVHLMLRDQLARGGAYEQARRFHAIGLAILGAAGDSGDAGLVSEGLTLLWYEQGPDGPLQEIARQLAIERDRIMRMSQGEGLAVMKPEDVRLAPSFEELRAMLLLSKGEAGAEELARSMADMAATTQVGVDTLNDPARRAPELTEESAKEAITLRKLALAAYRALTSVNAAEAQTTLAEILAALPPEDARRTRVDAWALLAAGDAASALVRTRQIEEPLIWDRVCEARALDMLGRGEEAVGAYDAARSLEPLSPLAAWAWTRASTLRKTPPAAESLANEIEAVGRSVPAWVDTMLDAPRRFQLVMVDLDPQNAGPLERSSMVLTLRNLSPIPLALGTGKPINTRFFLAPAIELGSRAIQRADTGEVIEVDRRLRLMPRESMSVRVWPEIGLSGHLVERGLREPSRSRWRVLQGFEFKSNGRREAGPGSLEAMSTTLAREALPEARLTAEQLAAKLADRSVPEAQIAALIAAARAMLSSVAPAEAIADPIGTTSATSPGGTASSTPGSTPGSAPPTPASGAGLFDPPAPTPTGAAGTSTPEQPKFSFATAGPKPISHAQAEVIAKALTEAYPTWTTTLRQLAIATLPPAGEVTLLKELDALMVADADPSARLLALMSRIAAKDDAALAALINDPDPRVARVAALHAGRLDADAYVYAKGGVPLELGGPAR